ncbi:MAG: spore germination protein, partial [Firmicutes bacterium]|nr:spore germination protein [Bacillota bacterium]
FSAICIVLHVCTLRSFGVPYTAPLAPLSSSALQDTLVRAPWWSMQKRPIQENKGNTTRQTNTTTPANRLPGFKRRRGRPT